MTENEKIVKISEELDKSTLAEIQKHKWIESQKVGTDIGITRASKDWFDKCFDDWKKNEWDSAIEMADKPQKKRINRKQIS